MSRYNIRALAAQPKKVNLVHPVVGETDIWVEVVGPQSRQFREAIQKFEALSPKEQTAEANVAVFTACILSWDEEGFGERFSSEAALRIFLEPENTWMSNFLISQVRDAKQFFRSPD